MADPVPPRIFDADRRRAAYARALRSGVPQYVLEDMIDDTIERLAFLRFEPERALVIGDRTGGLLCHLAGAATAGDPRELDEERPYPDGDYDFIASLGTLATVNDLPGALVHLRQALAPGGLLIASFAGAGSLQNLRAIMLAADGDLPSARMHPMVDVQAGAALLQRAGFADPVADSHTLSVRYSSLASLLGDVRGQALGSALADRAPCLDRAAYRRANEAFDKLAGPDGKLLESFEIMTISGRRPKPRF